jgi:sugar transferase (PEP-CTERM/EpsH1 system associated)
MRTLYFAAHQMLPLSSGNRLRDYHLARGLAKHACVTFVEVCHPGEVPSRPPGSCEFNEIISLKKGAGYTLGNITRGLAGPTPLTVLNYFQTEIAFQLSEILARHRYDTVQMEGVHLSNYLPQIQEAPGQPEIVVDWHNVESDLMWQYWGKTTFWPKRILARRTAILLERQENMLLEKCTAHTVVSEHDRQKLLERCPSARVHIIPNGVDAHSFYAPEVPILANDIHGLTSKPCVLFVGSMDYHANIEGVIWFAHEIWPEIAEKHPELNFVIVGRRPSRSIRALASERIRVTGTVDDVRPFYRPALTVVVPLRVGSGTRLKILEAMAAGVPVVSTRLGAEGIDAVPDIHLLIGDNRDEMIAAINKMVNSASMRDRLTLAARDLVVNRYDWGLISEKLYRIHRDLIQTSPGSSSTGNIQ